MNYKLVGSRINDIEKLSEYKKRIIYEYAKNLSDEEIKKINNYVENDVEKMLNNYFNIVTNNKIVGCLLLTDKNNSKLLEELYLEENYRNKGIGTDIIKNILKENSIVSLWVCKENIVKEGDELWIIRI